MSYFSTKQGKKVMNSAYGIGAAIVIIGALFKITHWPFADLLLTIGLITEAIIFIISAFDEPSVEYDWELVYPQLAGMDPGGDDSVTVVQRLDKMMEQAKIDNEIVERLGDGMRKISVAADGLGDVATIAESTSNYSNQVENASKHLEAINAMYEDQINSSSGYTNATKKMAENMELAMRSSTDMQNELSSLTKNLSSLNAVYGNMLTAMNPGGKN